MSSPHDDEDAARAEAILAAEAEEEAQLELAMQLLRTQTVNAEADTKAIFKAAATAPAPKPPATSPTATSFPLMPSPTPQSDALPAVPAEAGTELPPQSSSSAAGEGKVLSASSSQPSLSSSSSASALSGPVPSGGGGVLANATASPALSSAPSPSFGSQKPIINRKKKSFTTGGMDIDSLVLSSDTDEEERERIAARKAKAAAALASANASKKAAAASKQASIASTPKRTPSQSPVRGPSPAPAPRPNVTSALRASHGSGLPPRKPASVRPVSGVSPSMLPPAAPASSHKSSRSHRDDHEHAHEEPRSHSHSSGSHGHDHPRESQRSPRPHSASSSAANAALESRIRELEQHVADQSYTRDYNHQQQRPASSPQNLRHSTNHPMSPSASSNSLKLRILELEKDALVSAQTISNLESKLHAMEDHAAQADRTHVRELAVAREREDALRADLSAQISELDQRNFQLSSELKELKASGAAAATSYRQLVAKDGGSLPASAIPDPTERAKITAELKSSDELINQLVLDSQRIHNEKDSVEKKYKAQIQALLEDQKHHRIELQNKDAELTRLRVAHNSTLDPSARAELQSYAAREEQLREKHHQEVSSLKYELDKLRAVRLELALTKEDSTRLGKDSLRLSLASLQEKYDTLKVTKECEVRELHTKLVWYIENQALITDLEASLKALRLENENLRDENLIMNHAIPRAAREEAVAGGVAKLKPRPQDAKRIKELEARNAELTELIKKKASASGVNTSGTSGAPAPLVGLIAAIKPSMEENSLIQSLRARIAELEAAALARDESSSTALRSLRQETDQIKLMWEKRLAKLTKERDEARKRIPLVGRRKMDRVTELEKQVEEMRAFYTDKTRRLSSLVTRLKRGETVEETEMADAEAEAQAQHTQEEQGQQENHQPRTLKDEEHKEASASAAPSSHDSQPLPAQASRTAAPHPGLNHSVLEQARSPLKAHPHPSHPNGGNGSVSHTNDFLLFKQSLVEAHDRELHHLAAKYEQQLQHLKAQWESQVQMLRATGEADSKLQQSLLQQARDECAAVRSTLAQESSARSLLTDRCLALERDLLQARNQGGYIDYHQLRSELDQVHARFEQKIREYEAAAQISREDIRVERAGWAEQVRAKHEQLEHAKNKFHALTRALKQMQEQMASQQSQHLHQHPGAVAVGSPAADLGSTPSAAAAGVASDDEDDIAHLVSPHRGSSSSGASTRAPPPPPPVNEQAMQLQWSYLTGGAAPLLSPPQPQPPQQQPPQPTMPQPQQTPAQARPAQRGRTPQSQAAPRSRQSSSPSPARDHPVRQGAVHFASHVRG